LDFFKKKQLRIFGEFGEFGERERKRERERDGC
jgi:hypothetical protein